MRLNAPFHVPPKPGLRLENTKCGHFHEDFFPPVLMPHSCRIYSFFIGVSVGVGDATEGAKVEMVCMEVVSIVEGVPCRT
jgi:hypothetical protein